MNLSVEQQSILTLNLIPEMEPRLYHAFINHYGSAQCVLEAPVQELLKMESISGQLARNIAAAKKTVDTDNELARTARSGVTILTCIDKDYPESLKNLPDFPPILYVRGNTKSLNTISIALVGTRLPTAYGRSVAAKLGTELAEEGITTISGLARGIDTEIHKATLEAGGQTIAVLGNGLARHYPPENRKLEDLIAENGALLTEFRMDTMPDKRNFPRRNRLISGLSLATVVIEADMQSGALITARFAAEQGKDVFAVPGPIFSKFSHGPHYLVKSGAHLVESVDDIVEEIAPLAEWWRQKKRIKQAVCKGTESLSEQEQRVFHILELESEGVSIDTITKQADMMTGQLASSLLSLELKGLIRSLPGKIYIRSR